MGTLMRRGSEWEGDGIGKAEEEENEYSQTGTHVLPGVLRQSPREFSVNYLTTLRAWQCNTDGVFPVWVQVENMLGYTGWICWDQNQYRQSISTTQPWPVVEDTLF